MAKTNKIYKILYMGECNDNFKHGEQYSYDYIENVTGIPAKVLTSRLHQYKKRKHLTVTQFSEKLLFPHKGKDYGAFYVGKSHSNFKHGQSYSYEYIAKATGLSIKILTARLNKHKRKNLLCRKEFTEKLLFPAEERTPFVVTSVCETSMEKLSAYWLRQKLCH